MKIILYASFMFYPLSTFSVWEMMTRTKPNSDYMNFFYRKYIPWFETKFKTKLSFPDSGGEQFFHDALKHIDHWKIGSSNHDQFLIGLDENRNVSISLYLHPEVRNHKYIKNLNLNFSPFFISWEGKELCLSHFSKKYNWKHVPSDGDDYLSHFCQKNGKFELTYISFLSKVETKKFKNPFEGMIDREIVFFNKSKQVKSFFKINHLHMAFIPKSFFDIIMEHGSASHLPLDKFSLNESSTMTIYYP
jgi:hypothetical protein